MRINVSTPDGARVEISEPHGSWVVDPNGTLHIRSALLAYVASWPAGQWLRVNTETVALRRFGGDS